MLTVYRASAGAGKTYRLTGDYLVLLFSHPMAYRRILAVTFTNKATDEMKTRIIEALYQMSTGDSRDYIDLLIKTYSLTEEQVRREAHRILTAILHDYSAFNISTIDRFFQQIMRAFTREIGLQGGYGIEMDQELVLTESVDRLLADLERPDNKELLGWLLRFAEDKIESGSEWNLRREIMGLSRELFKENYKAFSRDVDKDVEDKEALEDYKKNLSAIIQATEAEAKRLGERGLSLLSRYNLKPTDFKGGSRSQMGYLEKLARGEMKPPTATFISFSNNAESCYTKTAPSDIQQAIQALYEDGLYKCICDIISFFENLTSYYTAKEVIRYYYTLGILTDISHQVALYREEKNIMLIADTTELLNKVIDGSDTPFIYEKTGTNIDHYMIDEFQDTSNMQWNNFRPLIKESLAHQRNNLIVGDVKQSIYRFRNSDWKLLDKQIQKDFMSDQLTTNTLKENWRSSRHIVDFNNALFTATPALLQSIYNDSIESSSLLEEERREFQIKIMSAYDKSFQQVAPPFMQKEGHVRVEFMERAKEEGDSDWKEKALARIPAVLEQLQDNGYQLQDIAILTRTNQEAALVADTLLTYKEEHPSESYFYDIISDDALFINSSSAVRLLISMLRYLRNPDDRIQEAIAQYSYLICIGDINKEDSGLSPDLKEKLLSLSGLSLYEVVEGLYRLFVFCLPVNEQVFVQAFLDMISDFTQKESADLNRFLKWWDDTGCRKTIATPETRNAIRILTIHKSKGLGFKAVIMPFTDWEIDHKPTKPVVLWCQPSVPPFNKLRLVPVRYGQVLAQTIFAKDYFEEKLHAYIDNLNTLYVALTRAKEELIVFAPHPKKVKEATGEIEKINSIADLLWVALSLQLEDTSEEEKLIDLPVSFDYESAVFELGNWWKISEKKKKTDKQELVSIQFSSIPPDDRLHLRLYGKELVFDDKQRKYGMLMHDVLSKVCVVDDITLAVECYLLQGVVNKEEASMLIERLKSLLSQPTVAAWYDGSARVLNEVEILFGEGLSKRPDRVMIVDGLVVVVDYKFGEKQNKRYTTQVRDYLKLIQQMGYKHITGYLWYVELDKIEEVIL